MPALPPGPHSARYAAIETLVRLQRTHFPVKALFDQIVLDSDLSAADRRLAMNLVYGALRQRHYLELLISQLCHHPLSKLEPQVRQALSVGLYQLFCLQRIPESAAVNETVNACKPLGLARHLLGLVNGILRSAVRQRPKLPVPGEIPPGYSHPPLNHPIWLTRRWQERFGEEEMRRICQVNSEEPPLVLRVNTSRTSTAALHALFEKHDLPVQRGRYAADALVLPRYQGNVFSLPGYSDGLFQVQDEAAQLAVQLLAPLPPDAWVLDACAGVGGKTSTLRQQTAGTATQIVAVEPDSTRQRLFAENMARLCPPEGAPILFKGSLEEYRRICPRRFDAILLDAPCSGTGVCGRHPDIRWNRQAEQLPRYQHQQLQLLDCASQLLQPGGLLVYATCSLEAEENEQVVASFLAAHADFLPEDCRPFLPETAHELVVDGCLYPHPRSSIDGFFAARLRQH